MRVLVNQIVLHASFRLDVKKNVYTPKISELIRLVVKKKDTEVSNKSVLVHLTGALSNPSYAMKKLFQQVREGVIAKLLGDKPRLVEPITYKHQRRLTAEQKNILVDEYKAGGQSIYSLAKSWSISPHTVSTHLRKAGLSIGFKPLSYAEIAKARELREEGLSFNAIGRALNRDPKTIRSALL